MDQLGKEKGFGMSESSEQNVERGIRGSVPGEEHECVRAADGNKELIKATDKAMKKPSQKRVRKLGEVVDQYSSRHDDGPYHGVNDSVWRWGRRCITDSWPRCRSTRTTRGGTKSLDRRRREKPWQIRTLQ